MKNNSLICIVILVLASCNQAQKTNEVKKQHKFKHASKWETLFINEWRIINVNINLLVSQEDSLDSYIYIGKVNNEKIDTSVIQFNSQNQIIVKNKIIGSWQSEGGYLLLKTEKSKTEVMDLNGRYYVRWISKKDMRLDKIYFDDKGKPKIEFNYLLMKNEVEENNQIEKSDF